MAPKLELSPPKGPSWTPAPDGTQLGPSALSALVQAGDVITCRSPGILEVGIRLALSTGQERCQVNHDALVGEDERGKWVLDHHTPRAEIVPLVDFLAKRGAGGSWLCQPYRPRVALDHAPAFLKAWRLDISTFLRGLEGQDYSESQLAWIMFRNILVTKWLPWKPRTQWTAAAFCTGSVHDAWTKAPHIPTMRWQPRAYAEARLPTPLHTQRAVLHGELNPVGHHSPLHWAIVQTAAG